MAGGWGWGVESARQKCFLKSVEISSLVEEDPCWKLRVHPPNPFNVWLCRKLTTLPPANAGDFDRAFVEQVEFR